MTALHEKNVKKCLVAGVLGLLVCLFLSCPVFAAMRTITIDLNNPEKSIKVSLKEKCKLKVVNGKVVVKGATFTSSKKKVATVKNGILKAKKTGKTNLIIKCKGKKVRTKIAVSKDPVIELNKTSITLHRGDTYQLKATVYPKNRKVKWMSYNVDKASVKNGLVKALDLGEVYVAANLWINGHTITEYCVVNIAKQPESVRKKYKLSDTHIGLDRYKNTTATLTLSGMKESEKKNVKWSVEYEPDEEAYNGPDAVAMSDISDEYGPMVKLVPSGNKVRIIVRHAGCAYVTAECNGLKYQCRVMVDGYTRPDYPGQFIYNEKLYTNRITIFKRWAPNAISEKEKLEYGEALLKAEPKIFRKFINKYISKCSTDFQKLLALRAYYIDEGFVAEEFKLTHPKGDFLKSKFGMCQDYSLFTHDLLCVAGLPCELLGSQKMFHEFDQVKLDGKWTLVDYVGGQLRIYNRDELPDDVYVNGTPVKGSSKMSKSGYRIKVNGKMVDINTCDVNFGYGNEWMTVTDTRRAEANPADFKKNPEKYQETFENLLPKELVRN